MNATSQSAATPASRVRGATVLRIVFGLAGAAALFWLIHYGVHAYHYAETDDAYTGGHLHQIAARVGGQVQQVLVKDNQLVKSGQVLARLDPTACQIAVDRATAAVAQARAQGAQAESAENLAAAQLEEARARQNQAVAMDRVAAAQLELAQTSYKRTQTMFSHGGAATQADLDNASAGLNSAKANAEAAQASTLASASAVNSAEAGANAAHAQRLAAQAALDAANAALRDALRELSYTTITAPADGRIGNKQIEVGNSIQAGQSLFALAEPKVWIVANYKETQIARMKPGQEADITIDAIPGETLHGTVDSLSPASGAQFALLPPDNATGNFNKVVQRIPVKILLAPADSERLASRLRLGLSAVVEVRVR